ncbi:MAG: hypothetical protein HY906_09495 [Deltaproteobacteria bacterium]|nr:hypothetical protein [Deltaproteobacteria bacterium]
MARKPTTPPIARKVISSLFSLKAGRVVNLAAWRKGMAEAKRLGDTSRPSAEAEAVSRVFAAYTFVTNWVMGLLEVIQELPELGPCVDRIQKAEEEYMPSGPPMSPLTKSFFWHWMLYDVGVGAARETFGSVILAVGRQFKLAPEFLLVLEHLVEARLGLFIHGGQDGDRSVLRDLGTGEEHRAVCPAGYPGTSGELWLARVVPPLVPGSESVVMTTPYLIVGPDVAAWREYLDRTLSKTGLADRVCAYERLMKRGLDERYWAEYVFEAYVNHRPEVIFLRGLPDVPESRPHSKVNADKESFLVGGGGR